jgi:hypothetical protein
MREHEEATMRFPFTIPLALSLSATAFACGCASAPRESTVQGTAALSTFPSPPSVALARDESGGVARSKIDRHGQFSLSLAKGHKYRLAFEGSAATVPIVFPRSSGTIDATFALHTNGANLRLGQVRYYPSLPSGGFHVLAANVPAGTPSGDCVDCVNDDQQVTCDASESEGKSTEVEPTGSAKEAPEPADPKAELAVAEQNVPEDVSGCDDQEGEH